ncbi:MAG: hypothetical protein QM831_01965 [Kofleriaceae bacterium]
MRALLLVLLANTAHADEEIHAIAVNNPIGWRMENIAVSGYRRVADQLVIHVNVASTRDLRWRDLFSECSHPGRVFDVGAGIQYFFAREWLDGPFVEGGLVRRSADETEMCSADDGGTSPAQVTRYAAYGNIGWAWSLPHHAFIALDAGVSSGYEYGTHDRWVDSLEWSLRIGAQF